jgi:hypothetical protein
MGLFDAGKVLVYDYPRFRFFPFGLLTFHK